jgi:CSLREA domain-containing protein
MVGIATIAVVAGCTFAGKAVASHDEGVARLDEGAGSASECGADCDGNGVVALGELVDAIRIALGSARLQQCPSADGDRDGSVGLVDLLRAVDHSLGPCSSQIAFHGRCVKPGPTGLVPCDPGVDVRVLRCKDPGRCLAFPDDPGATEELETTQLSAEGRFEVEIRSGAAGTSALIFAARVNETTVYRTINFGTVGPGGGSGIGDEEILIGPSSEAAIRLMAENGFSSFSPEEVDDLLAAVEAANQNSDFSNLMPEAAANRAQAVAGNDPQVVRIIEEALQTPTATSTRTPTSTSTPTPTSTPGSGGGLRVTKTGDSDDGICDADCSLREAIAAADANPGPDDIHVPAGTYRLTVASLDRTRLFLSTDVNIIGAGRGETIIDGNGTGSVFAVQSATVRISDLTVTNGTADLGDGGGIFNAGTLTLERIRVTENRARSFGSGGGIFTSAFHALTLRDCVIDGNAARTGAGIYNDTSSIIAVQGSTISNNIASGDAGGVFGPGDFVDSTISGNSAAGDGGGIYSQSGLTLTKVAVNGNVARGFQNPPIAAAGEGGGIFGAGMTLKNTTVSGNRAEDQGGSPGQGGGIYAFDATFNNVTITANTASLGGGIAGGQWTMSNTLLASNSAGNCYDGFITSLGHNFLDIENDFPDCAFDNFGEPGPGDITADIEPHLAPLAGNGGPTMTHALLDGSPAVDAGDPASPGSGGTACEATDQRGVTRPVGGACDIGAYEGGFAGTPTPTATPTVPTPTPTLSPLCALCCDYFVNDCPQGGCDFTCDVDGDGRVSADELIFVGCNPNSCSGASPGGACATAQEGQLLTLECPSGVIAEIQFASYGTPSGTCGQYSTGACHAANSSDVVFSACAGLSSCSIQAINEVFGDPCSGTGKALFVQARCGAPGEPTPTPTPGGPSGCCVPNPSNEPGCGDATCEACVCAIDDACCSKVWDASCASTGSIDCAASCNCSGG